MSLDFVQVDVFADKPFAGNPLAVFPDAAGVASEDMQVIAREMNLSETSFVTEVHEDRYRMRIFTPTEEVSFAGHPTVGTAWVLRLSGRLEVDRMTQQSAAGDTRIEFEDDLVWFDRTGKSHSDLESTDPGVVRTIATSLGVDVAEVGLEARELGRSGRLRPALSDAGLEQLMVPVRDEGVLGRCKPPEGLDVARLGAYCFCAVGAGRIRARGLWLGLGVPEDPATGSAAAALGLYLADRIGDVAFEVMQGVEINRPSRIHVRASRDRVRVGGGCHEVFKGTLGALPSP